MTALPSLDGRQVFITGANGFVGRALADRCRGLGADVVGLDTTADLERGVVAGDIAEPAAWQGLLIGCDVLIHTAAVMTNNVEDAVAWGVNVVGTRRVIEATAQAGVGRMVHLSTMGVARFAQVQTDAVERFHPNAPLDERWPVMPTGNPYTDTKIAGEHAVLAAHAAGELAATIIRPADVYGPGCRPWVLEPLAAIGSGRFLLPNHGEGLFTAIYVDDLVEGIVAATTTDAAAGQIIHLGGEEPVTTAEYFGHFYRMLGLEGPPRSYSTRTATAIAETARRSLQLAHQPTELGRGVMEMLNKSRPVSNAKAHQLLGWAPKVSLDEGMAITEAWLRSNGHLDGPAA